jgi:hypothetical protein
MEELKWLTYEQINILNKINGEKKKKINIVDIPHDIQHLDIIHLGVYLGILKTPNNVNFSLIKTLLNKFLFDSYTTELKHYSQNWFLQNEIYDERNVSLLLIQINKTKNKKIYSCVNKFLIQSLKDINKDDIILDLTKEHFTLHHFQIIITDLYLSIEKDDNFSELKKKLQYYIFILTPLQDLCLNIQKEKILQWKNYYLLDNNVILYQQLYLNYLKSFTENIYEFKFIDVIKHLHYLYIFNLDIKQILFFISFKFQSIQFLYNSNDTFYILTKKTKHLKLWMLDYKLYTFTTNMRLFILRLSINSFRNYYKHIYQHNNYVESFFDINNENFPLVFFKNIIFIENFINFNKYIKNLISQRFILFPTKNDLFNILPSDIKKTQSNHCENKKYSMKEYNITFFLNEMFDNCSSKNLNNILLFILKI